MWLCSGGVDKDFDVGMYNVEGIERFNRESLGCFIHRLCCLM